MDQFEYTDMQNDGQYTYPDTTDLDNFDFEAFNAEVESQSADYNNLSKISFAPGLQRSYTPPPPPTPVAEVCPQTVSPNVLSLSSSIPIISQDQSYYGTVPEVSEPVSKAAKIQQLYQELELLKQQFAAKEKADTTVPAAATPDIIAQRKILPASGPKNKRPLNIAKFDPSKYYDPIPWVPTTWTSSSLGFTFRYTAQGELDPRTKLTPDELNEYLVYHPLHTIFSPQPDTKNSGLTLWIQNIPADAGNRYPTTNSSKCRFANCPVPNNTIRKGEFRIALDEWACSLVHEKLDPYHNAGYVHLFCLEKYFDFPALCKKYNVLGDNREFAEGRNKMAIIRDYPSMLDIVTKYIANSKSWEGEKPEDWYEHSLSLALTKEHLRRQPIKRQGVREKRDGNSIDRHLNNLDVMVARTEEIKEAKRVGTRVVGGEPMIKVKAPRNYNKRKGGDESELDDLWDQEMAMFKKAKADHTPAGLVDMNLPF
jgi:hypothetical protein